MKRPYFITIIVIGVLAAITIFMQFVNTKSTADSTANSSAILQEEKQEVPVEIVEVLIGNIVTTITETGVTKPFQSVTVATEISGKIVNVFAELGDYVQQSSVIAIIDDELPKLALEQVEAQLINASAAFEKAKIDLERYAVLRQNEEISEDEFENIHVQHELARSVFLSNKAAVQSAQRQVRNTKITSPISGHIAERSVETGSIVSVHQPIVKVVDIETIKIDINVSEQDVVYLKQNMSVLIQVDAYPNQPFAGKIYAVSPEASAQSHTFPIEVIVPNGRNGLLKSGMITRATIELDVLKDVILIPQDAVIERFGEKVVFVVNRNNAKKRAVILGKESGSDIQIVSGLTVGEKIVVSGQYTLEDDSRVRIQNQ